MTYETNILHTSRSWTNEKREEKDWLRRIVGWIAYGKLEPRHTLTKPLIVDTPIYKGVIPDWFASNFANVRPFNPIGYKQIPAVVHDWLNFTGEGSRKEADRIFADLCVYFGASKIKGEILYRGLRVFGWIAWNKHRRKQRQAETAYKYLKATKSGKYFGPDVAFPKYVKLYHIKKRLIARRDEIAAKIEYPDLHMEPQPDLKDLTIEKQQERINELENPVKTFTTSGLGKEEQDK